MTHAFVNDPRGSDECGFCLMPKTHPAHADAPPPESKGLDLEAAGKIIREVIQQHKHNVGWAKWSELSSGQKAGWTELASQTLRRLRAGAEGGATGG